ncbi:hypothetical protein D3C86_1765150 [compost metagenome]
MVRCHAGSIVPDFENRQLAVAVDKQFEPDLRLVVDLDAMAPAVAHQIVEYLGQLVRVHQGFEVARPYVQVNLLTRGRALAGFGDELFQPRLQVKPMRHGLLATGQLQDVFDYPIHSLRVVLNNLGQTSIRAIEFL